MINTVAATPRHEELRNAVIEAVRPFEDIPAIEQLAVLSSFIGQLIALQDGTKYTPAAVTRLVAHNIEMGNARALTAVAMGEIKP